MDLGEPNMPPITVLLIIGWLFGSFAIFPFIHAFRLIKDSTLANAVRCEVLYSIASFTSKLPLLAIIAGGLVARRETIIPEMDGSIPNDEPIESDRTVFIGIGIGSGTALILGFAMATTFWDILWPKRK